MAEMSQPITMTVATDRWPFRKPFRIASGTLETVDFLTVTLRQGEATGQGEGIGILFRGETLDSMREQVESVRRALAGGAGRLDIQSLLPPGGARNAIDCALWDLECKQAGQTIWDRLGVAAKPLQTVYTIGIDAPEPMVADARSSPARTLKIKIAGVEGLDLVRMIRQARPDARLIVDANRSLTEDSLHAVIEGLVAAGVEMLEQPLQPGQDDRLAGIEAPILLCADESCLTRYDLSTVAPYYDMINVKLDKTGGLTEALALAQAARENGLSLMVGCMAGTSLSMAPAFVIGQMCTYVDLDGPLLMARDRDTRMAYLNDEVHAPPKALWG
jgi:L-Ala-D/L-Glu epimerase